MQSKMIDWGVLKLHLNTKNPYELFKVVSGSD